MIQLTDVFLFTILIYSVRRLIGSQIESAAYCNQKFGPIYTITVHKTRRLIESFGYCYHFYAGPE